MTAPQNIMIVILAIDCIVFLYRMITEGRDNPAPYIIAFFLRYGILINTLLWGGFWS